MQLLLAALLGRLSLPVVRNLLALDGRQQMNAVFGPWRLVNTYGDTSPCLTRAQHPRSTHAAPAQHPRSTRAARAQHPRSTRAALTLPPPYLPHVPHAGRRLRQRE